jgi:hypothetical protein
MKGKYPSKIELEKSYKVMEEFKKLNSPGKLTPKQELLLIHHLYNKYGNEK